MYNNIDLRYIYIYNITKLAGTNDALYTHSEI